MWCGCSPCGIELFGHIWPCGTDCDSTNGWSGVYDSPNDYCDDACYQQSDNNTGNGWGDCQRGLELLGVLSNVVVIALVV